MYRMDYEDAKRIAIAYGYDDFSEPLAEINYHAGRNGEDAQTHNTLLGVKKNGKWGWIDAEGNVKIPFEYDYGWALCTNGIILLDKDGRRGGLFRKDFSQAFAFKYEGVAGLGHVYEDTFISMMPGDDLWGLVKPGDIRITESNKYDFLINNGERFTGFRKRTLFGWTEGRIDLLTGHEM